MKPKAIITIGGSAGSIESLKTVLRGLPDSLPAAIFVVIHRRALERSWLAQVLNHSSNLVAAEAVDSESIEAGRIYLAPPDRHLLIAEEHVHLTHGPKEGLNRPSINITFRSAAHAYGRGVIGVLLSGMLDDGASGLWEIVHLGGITIVQDPEEAQFPSMPLQALQDVPINYKLPAAEISERLIALAGDTVISAERPDEFVNDVVPERFSGFTCPECRGPLFDHRENPKEFRCRTGHIFSFGELINQSAVTREAKMYEALVSLEEGADLAELAAKQAPSSDRQRFASQARQIRRCAVTIRKLVEQPDEAAEPATKGR